MKNLSVLIIIILTIGISGYSQDELTGIDANRFMVEVNPAFAGTNGLINISANHSESTGTLFNNLFFVDSKLPIFKSVKQFTPSISFVYKDEHIGTSSKKMAINFSNHFNLGKVGTLNLGIQYYSWQRDYSSYPFGNPTWNTQETVPPSSFTGLSFGIRHSFFENRLYYGVSYRSKEELLLAEEGNPTYNVNVGGRLTINDLIHIVPTVYLRSQEENVINLVTKIYYKELVYIGGSYWNSNQFYGVMAGGRLGWDKTGRIEIGANYGKSLNGIQPETLGIYLNYVFLGKEDKGEVNLY